MRYRLKAVFRNGTFVPEVPCDLPEEAQVDLLVQGPLVIPPSVISVEETARILNQVTQRMQNNPIPAAAARFTRAGLHERR